MIPDKINRNDCKDKPRMHNSKVAMAISNKVNLVSFIKFPRILMFMFCMMMQLKIICNWNCSDWKFDS